MADTTSLEGLKEALESKSNAAAAAVKTEAEAPAEAVTEAVQAPVAVFAELEALPEPKKDELGRSYATGKRKNAIARVWINRGSSCAAIILHISVIPHTSTRGI